MSLAADTRAYVDGNARDLAVVCRPARTGVPKALLRFLMDQEQRIARANRSRGRPLLYAISTYRFRRKLRLRCPTTRPPCMRLCLAYPGYPRRYIEGESPHLWRDLQSRVLRNRRSAAPIVLGADQLHTYRERSLAPHQHRTKLGSAAILMLMTNCSYVSCSTRSSPTVAHLRICDERHARRP